MVALFLYKKGVICKAGKENKVMELEMDTIQIKQQSNEQFAS